MTYGDNQVKVLLSSILSWAKENNRPVVLISSTRRTQIEIGMVREGYPRLVNAPYIKRHHGVQLTMTSPGILEKIETGAFDTGVPSCQQFIDMLDDLEQQWVANASRGVLQPYKIGGIQVTGYLSGPVGQQYALFDYAILPEVIVEYKSDYGW